jgi:hypothetical protein
MYPWRSHYKGPFPGGEKTVSTEGASVETTPASVETAPDAQQVKVQVKDNFLTAEQHQKLIEDFKTLPWTMNEYKVDESESRTYNNVQFVHTFHRDHGIKSEYFDIVQPIIDTLKPNAILRIKANLQVGNGDPKESMMHVDTDAPNSKTAVYFLETNNGYTTLEGGTKVDSVGNRMLTMPSNLLHCGTTCSDQQTRVVININYY